MNTKRTWQSGPPPHVGWWNASVYFDENAWRWWDGLAWSHVVYEEDSDVAVLGTVAKSDIWWTDYYPENARVPRIKP